MYPRMIYTRAAEHPHSQVQLDMSVMPASVIDFQSRRNSNSLAYESELGFEQSAEFIAEDDNNTSANTYQEGWIISYVDILTLLLTLFIILLAMSHFKPDTSSLDSLQIKLTESKDQQQNQDQISGNSIEASSKQASEAILTVETTVKKPVQKINSIINTTDKTTDIAPEVKQNDQSNSVNKLLFSNNEEHQQNNNDTYNESNFNINTADLLNNKIDITKILPVGTDVDTTLNEIRNPVKNELYILNPDIAFVEQQDQDGAPVSLEHTQIYQQIKNSQLLNKIDISEARGQVNLIISDHVLFTRASDELKPDGIQLLKQLAGMINDTHLNISVEGHTDNIPINNQHFQSNWELSTARATNVTRHLIENNIAPHRIRAIGYADTRPRAKNETRQGRARNRRVSIIMHMPETTAHADAYASTSQKIQ